MEDMTFDSVAALQVIRQSLALGEFFNGYDFEKELEQERTRAEVEVDGNINNHHLAEEPSSFFIS
jgi:hypothetical protein